MVLNEIGLAFFYVIRTLRAVLSWRRLAGREFNNNPGSGRVILGILVKKIIKNNILRDRAVVAKTEAEAARDESEAVTGFLADMLKK